MRISVILCLFVLGLQLSHSQSGMPLKESNKMYLHGASILIGNNILGHHRDKPLMDDDVANDMVKMKYIDVDDDRSTFSSSEASIRNAPKNSNIAYAALYWSALYPFNRAVARRSGNKIIYKSRGKRDSIVNSILFKRPNDAQYIPITGKVIFDSYKEKAFENNMPYVSYADVTSELQELADINGTYTVANVRATEGQISGGGSAGWLLYIVYEDERESLKYFTTYDGLVEVNRRAVEISFKGFKNKEDGNIQTTIALGAMEGDRKIKTDELSIFSTKSSEYKTLSTPHREENNFFNSSITIGGMLFSDRNPNSSNTLGFDLLKMEIPNERNQILDNSTTQAKLKFETRADRFYLHFVAFETEISQDYLAGDLDLEEDLLQLEDEKNIQTPDSLLVSGQSMEEARDAKKAKEDAAESNEKDSKRMKSFLTKKNQVVKAGQEKTVKQGEKAREKDSKQAVELTEEEKEEFRKEIVEQPSRNIPGLKKGYYIVTNVFAVPSNAKRWTKFLEEKGHEPKSIINPANNWDYIFIEHGEDLDVIFKEWLEYRKLEYFEDIWVMKVNFT